MRFEYEAILHEELDGGAWVPFPWDISEMFGKGRIRVHAAFDGIPYDGSIVKMGVKNPDGSVCYVIGVLKEIRKKIGKKDHCLIVLVIRSKAAYKLPSQPGNSIAYGRNYHNTKTRAWEPPSPLGLPPAHGRAGQYPPRGAAWRNWSQIRRLLRIAGGKAA